MTKSEANTISFFSSIGIKLTKIDEAPTETPDYHALVSEVDLFIEVKEIVENENEKLVLKKIEQNDELFSYHYKPMAKRVRDKIKPANKQLKKLCTKDQPGILVIQDLRSFFTKSVIPTEEIKLAMFGERQIWRTVPHPAYRNKKETTADIFGPNKSNTNLKNTHTSAVCLLICDSDNNNSKIFVYHNPFSKHPLPQKLMSHPNIIEYAIPSTSSYCNFEKL